MKTTVSSQTDPKPADKPAEDLDNWKPPKAAPKVEGRKIDLSKLDFK